MGNSSQYAFSKGQDVPEWVYRVSDIATGEVARPVFGVDGVVVVKDGMVYVCPSEDRDPEAFVFNIEGFWGSAKSGHPKGDAFLRVFRDEAEARDNVVFHGSQSAPLIPADDPRG